MLYEEIQNYIENKDMESLKRSLVGMENAELLSAFHSLSSEEQVIVFRLLSKEAALSLFEQLDTDMQHNLLRSFAEGKAAEFVNEMAPDDRVKLLDELPASVAKKLIASLSPEERAATNILMGYRPETAGRIMTTEYISLQRQMTVEQALNKVRHQAVRMETVYTLYVTDSAKKLKGVLSLKDLIITNPDEIIENIMHTGIISVSTDTDQEAVARKLQELDFYAIPVTDSEDRLVGIVTFDDAMDILEEETTEDILDQAGLADITNNELDRSEVLISGTLWSIWKVRLPFLLATMALGMVSGLVIDGFEHTLKSITAVAIFIPVIMGMGGNVGTQSSTVFARGVVLGQIQIKNFLKYFLKEVGVGLSIGSLVGVIAGVIAALWIEPMLGLAVGFAMIITVTIAALLGFLVPYVLIRCKVDQAAGSAPIITTLKDLLALVIYFVCVNIFLANML